MTTSEFPLPAAFELADAASYPHVQRVLERGLTPGTGSAEPQTTVRLEAATDLVEGAFDVTTTRDDGGAAVTIRGGGLSGLIYGAQELVGAVQKPGGTVPERLTASPSLEYRVVWTWDHSTNWDVVALGAQDTGAFNPYLRQPEVFESDYYRLIDFLSDNRVAALVIYGLFRSGHGGVESAQRVCNYAKERGVRLLPGVAINAYGGFYYEGEHQFNLATWLRKHPELALPSAGMSGFSIDDYGYVPFPRADYSVAADPHQQANYEWHLEGIDWILDTVDVGGLCIEFGDYAGNDLLDDMRRLLPGVLERARAKNPDGWLMSELGWDHLVEPGTPDVMAGLPEDCVYQYTYNKSYWPRLSSNLDRAMVDRLPTPANVLRAQAGTQWNQQRHSLIARHFFDAAKLSASSGLDGFAIFSEASDYHPVNEFNYLAYARASYDGALDWDQFVAEDIAPRLGGDEAAAVFFDLAEGLDEHQGDMEWLRRAAATTRDAANGFHDEPYRRWLWLEETLHRHIYNLDRLTNT